MSENNSSEQVPTFRSIGVGSRSTQSFDPFALRSIDISSLSKSSSPKSALQHLHQSWLIPSIPEYAHIERSSLRIKDVPIDTIIKRMSSALSNQSIQCTQHHESGRLECHTERLLKFVIQLYKDESCFIMEVQRRQGCSIAMKNVRKSLFQTVLTGQMKSSLEPKSLPMPRSFLPPLKSNFSALSTPMRPNFSSLKV